jgi:MFS family permease
MLSTAATDIGQVSEANASYPDPRQARYALGVLTLVYVFSFLDRQVLNLLVEPVSHDLQISDTQMSLLIGFSFALFYTLFGLPLGRLADSRSRRGLIAAGFALWSAFTAGCGFAANFAQLMIMRMGVGVGEASLSPAAFSLITDYFPPHRRGRAQGIYNMGIFAGTGVALVLGGFAIGWLSQRPTWDVPLLGIVRWWQLLFIAIGAVGLLLVPLMFTISEPARRGATTETFPLGEVARHYNRNRATYVCHNLGIALLTFSAYGSSAWTPTFFIRQHGWSNAQAGIVLGLLTAVFGSLGVFSGGWLADRMTLRGHTDACMRVGFIAAVLWFPTGIGYLVAPSALTAAILYAPTVFFVSAIYSIGPAGLMQITPPRMRGQAAAIYLFAVNLIGLGIGPTAVALFTDYLFRDPGKVGYSILFVTVIAHTLAGILLWRGRRPFMQSRARLSEA